MPTIYNKRGLSNALNAVNPVLGSGEIVYVMDTNTLVVGNGSGVFSSLSGINAIPLTHSHTVSDITNFNTSVSGLLPTIANSGDNRILTSTGSSVGINAEANLTFDGTNLNLNNQTASTIASFDSSKNLVSLATATYPSLTELSYVKGVTSALQTQIDSKAATSTTITAGSGLAGGGSLAANRTIDIGQGDGITVSADSIAVDSTVIRTTGVQTMSAVKTFSAQTVFSSGTAAAPGISILGDTDTGLCQISSVGTNSLSISTSGVERVRFTSDGTTQVRANSSNISTLFTYNENGGELVHYDDAQVAATLLDQCNNQTRLLELINGSDLLLGLGSSNTTGSVRFMRAGFNEAMTITSSGNVGIGIATPTLNTNGTVLHIHNSTASRASMIRFTNNESGSTATDGLMVGKWSDGTNYVYDYDNYDLVLGAHNGNKVRIHSVGTSFYQSANGTPALGSKNFYAATFENLSAGYGLAIGGVNASTGSAFLQVQNFSTAAAYDLLLQPLGGNVGIGTSSPSNRFHVQGGELYKTTTDFVFGTTGSLVTTYHGASTGNTYGAIGALSAGGSAWNNLVLQGGGGNVGIGTTSPSTKLQINGQTRVTDGTTNIDFVSSSAVGYIGTQTNHPLVLRTNDTERIRITADGNVGIGTSPSVRLHISRDTADVFRLQNTAANGGTWDFKVGGGGFQNKNLIITRRTDGADSADLIINNTGNVGIASEPVADYKLFVNGGIRADASSASFPAILTLKSFTNTGFGAGLVPTVYSYTTTNGSYSITNFEGNIYHKIDSGRSNSASAISITNNNLRNYGLTNDAGSLGALFGIYNQYGHYNSSAVSPTTTSVIGIQNMLWRATGTITNAFDIYCQDVSSGATVTNRWGIYIEHTGKNYFAGNVGIGAASTSAPEVLSVMQDNNGGRTSILIDNLDQRLKMSCYYQAGVGQYAEIQGFDNAETGYHNIVLQRQGGEVLIGTATDNGAYKLQVNSQIYATNATIATSDSRFKTNVVSINNATSIIHSLRPVSFDFIPQTDRNFSTDRQIGLIAQEVAEALSNIDYKDSIVARCGDHFGLAYEKLVPLLIKALQETNQELQNIKNRLSALEGA